MKKNCKKAHLDRIRVSFLRKGKSICLLFMNYKFPLLAAVGPAQTFFDELPIKAIYRSKSASSRPAAAEQRSSVTHGITLNAHRKALQTRVFLLGG